MSYLTLAGTCPTVSSSSNSWLNLIMRNCAKRKPNFAVAWRFGRSRPKNGYGFDLLPASAVCIRFYATIHVSAFKKCGL